MAVSVEGEAQAPTTPAESSLNGVSGIISPREILRIAWEGVLRNKVRSLLTMLGIIIGVAAVIIMISISTGTEKTIEDQITGLGTNLVFVQANFSRGGFGPGGGGDNSGGLVYDDAFAVTFNTTNPTGAPKQFDITVPLQERFVYDPSKGVLAAGLQKKLKTLNQ